MRPKNGADSDGSDMGRGKGFFQSRASRLADRADISRLGMLAPAMTAGNSGISIARDGLRGPWRVDVADLANFITPHMVNLRIAIC